MPPSVMKLQDISKLIEPFAIPGITSKLEAWNVTQQNVLHNKSILLCNKKWTRIEICLAGVCGLRIFWVQIKKENSIFRNNTS